MKAALGVKIVAPDLEKAIAGSRLMVVGPDDDEDEMVMPNQLILVCVTTKEGFFLGFTCNSQVFY